MKANDTATASNKFVNDPDAFIKLCNSPRKRKEREQLIEKDRAMDTMTRFAYEILLAIGLAFLIVAMFR